MIAERKAIIDNHFPEICSCRIGTHWLRWGAKAKCCVPCYACHQRVKGDEADLEKHQETCPAYLKQRWRVENWKGGDEIVKFKHQGTRCIYCLKGVAHGMMEWHWKNNPGCPRYQDLHSSASIAEPPGDGDGQSSKQRAPTRTKEEAKVE